ncbi:YqhA family protein [Prosthecochloris sp. SCSIO W1101]|uniref:YqhA family protein n=1 Tax=Prosthecochloris sp. SCSIO W1101 TaxID=2992242 RepID=UPI00223DD298|nr:YqhA family protein [Prosthecochloris sp. SCSIO W1101]UZJ42139.1 YqhA family protein [Prosthecochloris sp. SCSIO W1101]
MKFILSNGRYMVIIGVIGAFIAAVSLFIYGGVLTVQQIIDTIQTGYVSSKGSKALMLSFVEIADIFLIGTVMYIISTGLYELFIDDNIEVPDWLEIHTLDDLKQKLIGVVIVVMSVVFLGHVIKWHGETEIVYYGAAIAFVVVALTYFTGQKKKTVPEKKTDADS